MRQTSKKDLFCFGTRDCLLAIALTWMVPLGVFSQNSANQNTGSWQPPRISPSTPRPVQNPEKWWPDQSRDQGVRTAAVEVELPKLIPLTQGSPDWVSPIEETKVEEISGMLDSFEEEVSWTDQLRQKLAGADVQKMFGSLAIVLGGYFGFVWVWRRVSPGGSGGLPSEVLEVVGQTPFGPKKSLQLVRLGTKLLLLINGPEGTHPIGEITDTAEVDHITTICSSRGSRGKANKKTVFKQLVEQIQDKSRNGPPATPIIVNTAHPQVIATPIIQQPVAPVSSSNGELERILKTLTQVVAQSKHQNEFEA